MSLLLLAQILTGLAVLFLLLGDRLLTSKAVAVRLKDEKIEAKEATKSSADLLVVLAGSVIGAGVAYAITGNLFFTVLGLSGGYFALKWMQKKRDESRRELLRQQYPDVLSQLSAATSGTLNPYQALEDTVPNLPRPARDIFYDVLRRTRTGDTTAKALDDVIERTGWEDLRTLSLAYRLHHSMGIDIDRICDYSLEAYYDQANKQGQIKGAISQNLAAIKILTGLPFLVIGIARVLSPDFTAPLFNTFEGCVFFMLCIAMIVLGNMIARKMIMKTMEG
ncbi:type II secretion system F family protein [Desulfofalx alkaliphila]|uniref:type II secretion system F family protein n=1 Tax=Desulfofalx alkaliphila TaxID=105483 RepID=UPI0004E13557|nr:type II secretion system F family protein [Desulfofalx alkaliphila]